MKNEEVVNKKVGNGEGRIEKGKKRVYSGRNRECKGREQYTGWRKGKKRNGYLERKRGKRKRRKRRGEKDGFNWGKVLIKENVAM